MNGDDIIAVCKEASEKYGIDVIPVESSGFLSGNKIVGYRAAGEALLKLIRPKNGETVEKTRKFNFIGEYNLSDEKWLVERYLREIGIEINVAFTGDSTVAALKRAPGVCPNLVQCSGSMHWMAMSLEKEYGTPYIDVNFFGAANSAGSSGPAGIPCVLATHVLRDALELGDKICVMEEGRVVLEGTPGEVLASGREGCIAEFSCGCGGHEG